MLVARTMSDVIHIRLLITHGGSGIVDENIVTLDIDKRILWTKCWEKNSYPRTNTYLSQVRGAVFIVILVNQVGLDTKKER